MKKLFLSSILLASFAGASATAAEIFEFEVTTTTINETFSIPLSGYLNGTWGKPYAWNINWDDGAPQTAADTDSGAPQNDANSPGIPHTYATPGTYTVTLTPAGSEDAWLAAFGFYSNTSGANAQANKNRLTKLVSPLTPLMTRTSAQISGTPPTHEWSRTFYNCQNLTMGDGFTFSPEWNTITSVGDSFASSMFRGCSGASFTMSSVFNLPTGITSVGDSFAQGMFASCSGAAFNMNSVFNLPTGITTVGSNFAANMFSACYGASFNMNSVFNLPTGITSAGFAFAYQMFAACYGASFTMNGVFNLPAGITSENSLFASCMFSGCSGAAFNMNSVFNLPPGITSVGFEFAFAIFDGCSGAAFNMNSVFNLPTGITSVGTDFASNMFSGCSGAAFQVNDVFAFPQLNSIELNKIGVFFYTFYNLGTASPQNRTATSIINGNNLSNSSHASFQASECFADRAYIHTRWGGDGQNADNILIVSHSSLTFPSETEGYAPVATRTVTVYNLGATTINGVSRSLTSGTAFNLGTLSDTTLPPGGSVTFTVTPQDNLPAGAHAGTITIGATGCASKTLDLSFTVLAHDTAFDIPDWDGSGIRITAFTVTPISNGDVTVDLDAVCASSLNPSKIRLLIFEDLSAPVPGSSTIAPDDITPHPSAVPPHHRAAWNFTLPSAPDRAFFRVTHED